MSSSLVAVIEQRLRRAGYEVARDVAISLRIGTGPDAKILRVVPRLVASRFYFCWKALGYISQNIFVSEVEDATVADLRNLVAAGEAYSKAKKSPSSYLSPLERVWARLPVAGGNAARIKAGGGYMIIPVLITGTPAPELIAYVLAKPDHGRLIFHLPAILDPDSGAVYYRRRIVVFGAAVYSEIRSVIARFIAPAAA